jgi:glycylpeptide N-tetradecanoyltransferase
MSEELKAEDLPPKQEAVDEVIAEAKSTSSTAPKVESEDEEQEEATPAADGGASASSSKKKKSKRKRTKAALTGASKAEDTSKDDISKAVGGLSKSQIADLLAMNPALARELGADGDLSSKKTAEAFKRLSLQDIMTGLAAGGKNAKDMASYKFWQTQPVPKLDDKKDHIKEGPFKIIDLEKVPKEPSPLTEGFEWVTMDLTREEELKEVFELLDGHYVEDEEAMFRFNYSASFLKWYVSLHIGRRFTNASQGFTCAWLEQRMACRRSSIQITEACGFYLCNSCCPTSQTKSAKSQ